MSRSKKIRLFRTFAYIACASAVAAAWVAIDINAMQKGKKS